MRAKATALIDKSLWAEVKKLATLSDRPAGKITEIALKLVLIIAKTGIPDDLKGLLAKHDQELLNELSDLHRAWGDD